MRIPSVEIKLDDMGYTGYFIKVPRSVKEGWVYDLQKSGTGDDENAAEEMQDNAIKVLSLVTEWNLDDDDKAILPLISSFETVKDAKARHEKQVAVVREIPIELIKTITEKVTASSRVSERVQGFSNPS